MKISKEQREQNRQSLFRAAGDLCQHKPIEGISMQAISKKAGLSSATIYKYFSTKEDLVFGFYREVLSQTLTVQRENMNFSTLPYGEKVKVFFDSYLERAGQSEHFFCQVFYNLFESGLPSRASKLNEVKTDFVDFFTHHLDHAIAGGEFAAPPFRTFLVELLWDSLVGVVHYWIKDQSEMKFNTTRMIDHGVDIIVELLKSDFFGKSYKLTHFLFKEHLLPKILNFGGHFDEPRAKGPPKESH